MFGHDRLKRVFQRALRRAGYNVYRLSEEEQKMFARREREHGERSMQAIFGAHLPRLDELRRRYAEVDLPVAIHSAWAARDGDDAMRDIGLGGVDMRAFRGPSAYVWDYAGSNLEAGNLKFYLFAEAARRKDRAGLLQRLTEDGAFGCVTFEYQGVGRVSRDLLDSIVEINFLDKHLGILERHNLTVLDVGAGYGRMAHRMLTAAPRAASYTSVDAVPESTFLCEFYTTYRGLNGRSRVLPLDRMDAQIDAVKYDLALNIHSFSECTYAAIEWWLGRLGRAQVRHLMIVPNDPGRFLSTEIDGSRRDYAPLLKERGYELIAEEPVFDDPAVEALMRVRDSMFLFELR